MTASTTTPSPVAAPAPAAAAQSGEPAAAKRVRSLGGLMPFLFASLRFLFCVVPLIFFIRKPAV